MKPFIIVFLLILLAGNTQADVLPDQITWQAVNDLITYGVTSNPDDLRSFGVRIIGTYDTGWFSYLQFSGLTNRYDSAASGSRLDELVIKGGYQFILAETGRFTIKAGPTAGVVIAGNLGLGSFQSRFHRLFGLTSICSTYDRSGKISTAPLGEAELIGEFRTPVGLSPESSILLRFSTSGSYAAGYEYALEGSLEAGIVSNNAVRLLPGIGYSKRQSQDLRPTHQLVSQFETGWEASMEARVGPLALDSRWNLTTLHGFSSIGMHLDRNAVDPPSGRDITVTHSAALPYPGLSTSFRYHLTSGISVSLRNVFFSKIIDGTRQVRQNFSTWLIGADYEFHDIRLGEYILPFISLEAGLWRLLGIEYTGGTEHYSVLATYHQFCTEAAAGIRLFQHGQISWKGVSFGLEAAGGIQYNRVSGIPKEHEGILLYLPQQWSPILRIGITLTAGI